MKILIINGSHRSGNTDIIISEITKQIKLCNHSCEELILRNIEIKLPDGCARCGESEICTNVTDQFSREIEPTLHDFDAYIIATPTWDDGVTPLTKIFWDRIVSWCHADRMYFRGKKLAIITHGMAGKSSWKNVINWAKSICVWEKAIYSGSLTFTSGSEIGSAKISNTKIIQFLDNIIKG